MGGVSLRVSSPCPLLGVHIELSAGIIERSAIEGQKAYHTDLEKAMWAYIQEHQSKFIPEGVDISVMKEERQSVFERSSATAVSTLAIEHPTVAQWQTVSSHMHSILLKKDLYKALLSQTGDQAQSLLNLLHQVCMFTPSLELFLTIPATRSTRCCPSNTFSFPHGAGSTFKKDSSLSRMSCLDWSRQSWRASGSSWLIRRSLAGCAS